MTTLSSLRATKVSGGFDHLAPHYSLTFHEPDSPPTPPRPHLSLPPGGQAGGRKGSRCTPHAGPVKGTQRDSASGRRPWGAVNPPHPQTNRHSSNMVMLLPYHRLADQGQKRALSTMPFSFGAAYGGNWASCLGRSPQVQPTPTVVVMQPLPPGNHKPRLGRVTINPVWK